MNSNKVALMLIAVLAVGIFALPSTVSLFSGQHDWYDLGKAGNDVPCIKCHADTYDEFMGTGVHAMLANGSTSNDTVGLTTDQVDEACAACHRTSNIQYAEGDDGGATPGNQAHAATAVACMFCHEYNASYDPVYNVPNNMAGFFAGGFTNMSGSPYKSNYSYTYPGSTTNGSKAAHNAFVGNAITSNLMEDSNEACVACHTNTFVNITWKHGHDLEFSVTCVGGTTGPTDPGKYNITDWAVNGTAAATHSYGNETTGNSTTWP